MRKFQVLLALTFSLLQVMSQNPERDSLLYATAYEYIESDSVGRRYNLLPSDILTGTYYMWFFQDARANSNHAELLTLTEKDLSCLPSDLAHCRDETALFMKMQRYDERAVPECRKFSPRKLLPFEPSKDKQTKNLYFSEIDHGELFAQFDGRVFYFIFNPDNTLKKVFAVTISD